MDSFHFYHKHPAKHLEAANEIAREVRVWQPDVVQKYEFPEGLQID